MRSLFEFSADGLRFGRHLLSGEAVHFIFSVKYGLVGEIYLGRDTCYLSEVGETPHGRENLLFVFQLGEHFEKLVVILIIEAVTEFQRKEKSCSDVKN